MFINESLYAILAHGSDDEIDEVIYRSNEMTPSATRVCTQTLTHHFRALNEHDKLLEKAVSTSGDFSLLIVLPTWKPDTESNYLPIIVRPHANGLVVAGVMMPFNDLMPYLDEGDSDIAHLTIEWIVRKTKPQ